MTAEELAVALYGEVSGQRGGSTAWSQLFPATRDAWIAGAAAIITRYFPEHAIRPVSADSPAPPQPFEVVDGERFMHRQSGRTWIFFGSESASPFFLRTPNDDVPPDPTATP